MAEANPTDFDFVEVVVYDVHCRGVAKMISKKRYNSACKSGVGTYNGLIFFGIDGTPNVHPDFGSESNFCNVAVMPIQSTLTPCHEGKGRVGHVICDVVDSKGTTLRHSPRTLAQSQLERLAELGLTIKSSTEIEFDLQYTETGASFAHEELWANLNVLEVNQGILLEFIDQLAAVGVKVDSVESECGPGMFEFTCEVVPGLEGPDSTARFRNVAKAFFKQRGLTATFMTRPNMCGTSSGMHFNHSLWTQDGQNAFLDEDKPNKFSDLGRHWMAGLVKHGPAIAALCCPTVNCYRRVGADWAPEFSDWGVDHRGRTFRLKPEGTNVYVENRLPSGASNPYLVMAATVAAGLDGVENKLELPSASAPCQPLPKDLEYAMSLLQADDVIMKALGPFFVKHFINCKKTYELGPLKEVADLSAEERFKKERALYFENA